MLDYRPNKFYFELVDCSGTKTTQSFEEDTWTNVMDNFVTFLKGCGFSITDEQLADYFAESAYSESSVAPLEPIVIRYKGNPLFDATVGGTD